MIDINGEDFGQITHILATYLRSDDKAYAFGSRVQGTARKHSDLDIAIEGLVSFPTINPISQPKITN